MVSLYTSISIQEAITNATRRIQSLILDLSKQDVTDLLTVTLNNVYLSFNGQFPAKEKVSSITGTLVILFMEQLETIALSSHLSLSPHKRKVDDIYLQTIGEEMADPFHQTMNNQHLKLKFEIEKPEATSNGLELSLLDFKVITSKDGKYSVEFFQKNKNPLCVHNQSAIPRKATINIIRNERKRIGDRCPMQSTIAKLQGVLDEILRLNESPGNSIDPPGPPTRNGHT